LKKVAISIGDLNGIGLQIALEAHSKISKVCQPIYIIDRDMLKIGAELLNLEIPEDFQIVEAVGNKFQIERGVESGESGLYSFQSFQKAIDMALSGEVDSIVTLPVNKKSWELGGVNYKGHTDALRDILESEAIMLMGNESMFVALYTEHIPYSSVSAEIERGKIADFLLRLEGSLNLKDEKVAVLGLNPHSGDGGVLGSDEVEIEAGIEIANKRLGSSIFEGAVVPDIAFTPRNRQKYRYFVAMYHDQGLIPLKALYFDESINISLGLPIKRVSVDHGTAFDIAYRGVELNLKSYINAVNYAVKDMD
jgi:4-hydroxythreonine-4-phosphate dehydrogenase